MKKIKIDRTKVRQITPSKNYFVSLARSIVYQQISTKAGNAIWGRFEKIFPRKNDMNPRFLATLTDVELRSAGVSPQKISYLRDLAVKFLDKTIDKNAFKKMSDSQVKEHLVSVKGIGPWTADMFLIFALNRTDILPVGDLAIKKGFQKMFKLKALPSVKEMELLAEPYRGERTFFSLYLWDLLDNN